jgi:hypothetical protein
LIACAHLLELGEMAEVLLGEFFERHVVPAT